MVATNGNHGIRVNGSYVRSARPQGPTPVHSWWEDRLCVVDLIERSSAAPGSVYNGLEFEGTKFEANDAVGFANEEYPGIKEDTLLRLLLDLAVK